MPHKLKLLDENGFNPLRIYHEFSKLLWSWISMVKFIAYHSTFFNIFLFPILLFIRGFTLKLHKFRNDHLVVQSKSFFET